MTTKGRILIVEDDEIIATVEEWRLSTMGYTVCGKADNGTDALELVIKEKPDLVILDINLNGEMDGVDVAEVLMKQTHIPFIFLTANTDDAILKRANKTLQYGYIKKPFRDEDLSIAIELALARSRFIQRILKNNSLYEMVLNQLPLGIIITDTNGTIIYLNELAGSLIEWKNAGIGITSFDEVITIINEKDGTKLENIFKKIMQEKTLFWFPRGAVLITKDETRLPVVGNAAPTFNEKGEIEGMVFVTLLSLENPNTFKYRQKPL